MTAVTLIRPPAIESIRFSTATITPPVGLAYIAAAIRDQGHELTVIDAVVAAPHQFTGYFKGYALGLSLDAIVERIPEKTSVVGISVIFTHEWPLVSEMIKRIKAARADLKIVVGGEHVTSLPEFCLRTSLADFAVLGEGEETIVELLSAIETGSDLSAVEGISWRSPDGIRTNARRSRRMALDDIPMPAWEFFDLVAYHENRFVHGMYSKHLTVPILATRGCPYQCTYCSSPNMWTPRWIPRDPIKVVDEIEYYVNTMNARNFPFQDLTAIVKKDWIVSFCNEVINRKLDIRWQLPTGTRSEAIDEEVAGLLKKAGLIGMAYAPESGSDLTRRYIKKKMKADTMFQSIHASVSSGLNVAAFMVIGFPHDKEEHLAENMPFIAELAKAGVSDMAVSYFMALPGTELFYSLYDSGKMRLDREYFRHILASLSLVPSKSYSPDISVFQLFKWKLKMLHHFYSLKKDDKGEKGSFLGAIIDGLKGIFGSDDHQSRVQTALRNAFYSSLISIRTQFGPYWMAKGDEFELFERWADEFDKIRGEMIKSGQLAQRETDTTRLHETNVSTILKKEHAGVTVRA